MTAESIRPKIAIITSSTADIKQATEVLEGLDCDVVASATTMESALALVLDLGALGVTHVLLAATIDDHFGSDEPVVSGADGKQIATLIQVKELAVETIGFAFVEQTYVTHQMGVHRLLVRGALEAILFPDQK